MVEDLVDEKHSNRHDMNFNDYAGIASQFDNKQC